MPPLMTMCSVMWPCQLLNQQRKVSVMERTLNLESGHLSVSLISTSSCFCDLGQVMQLLTICIFPLIFALPSWRNGPWSISVKVITRGWRGWAQPTSGFITHLLDEHFWDATSLSPPCDQSKPRHQISADLWNAMSIMAHDEVLHRSNYILRNVPSNSNVRWALPHFTRAPSLYPNNAKHHCRAVPCQGQNAVNNSR